MSKNQSKHTVVQRGKELRNIKCHYTSFGKKMRMEVDASDYVMGGVLSME